MMERRRALTLPFTPIKDNLIASPFRPPTTCFSSENGKSEKQVSWTEPLGRKRPFCDSPHRNGTILFRHNLAAKIALEMARKKPRLILRDVLKTEQGEAYMERIKQRRTSENKGQVSSSQREHGGHIESPLNCRERRFIQRATRNDKNTNEATKCNQKSPFSPSQRSRSKRKDVDDEMEKEEKDIQEVIIGKDGREDYKFAQVVDCGLSLSWEPAEDTGGCDEFSPSSMKENWTVPDKEVQHSLKKKRKHSGSQCNGTGSPKSLRESVLRLTKDDGGDGGPVLGPPKLSRSEECGEYLESLDRSIVQFTVGSDDPPILEPMFDTNLEIGHIISTHRQSLSSIQNGKTKNRPSEPIVLSSDDEENCDLSPHSSPVVHKMDSGKDPDMQGQFPLEEVAKQQETSGMENMQLHEEDLPPVDVSLISNLKYSCMSLAFSTVCCGAHRGKSNGDFMMTEEKILLPLKDVNEEVEVILSIDRTELWKYSVWEQHELEAQYLHLGDEEPFPPAVLLLCVSETAAVAAQRDLLKLCVQHHETTNTDKVSPFILISLRDPLEGMEGAFLRSLLDLDCINGHMDAQNIFSHNSYGLIDLENFSSPVLSLDDSIKLITRTGLDPHLLSLLGLNNTVPQLNSDQDVPHSDSEKSCTPPIQLDVGSQTETLQKETLQKETLQKETLQKETLQKETLQKETLQKETLQKETLQKDTIQKDTIQKDTIPKDTIQKDTILNDTIQKETLQRETIQKGTIQRKIKLQPDATAEGVIETQLKPEEDKKEQELEQPHEKRKKEGPTPVYTLCHRRTKESYYVSMCKPDSSWTKFKHQGLSHRLIQFPPPPQKGGITVTMEDLQCLDSGQFLNDVIIDFYLKYLLHKAPAVMAERCHIFSSFFYKQLTRRDNASEGNVKDSCQRQRRHQRVKTWTRHVDIFKKDFLFVPVNQEAHWYLVVICFPGLDEPKLEAWNGPNSQMGKIHTGTGEIQEQEVQGYESPNGSAESPATPPTINQIDNVDAVTEKAQEESIINNKEPKPGPVTCTEQTYQKKIACKRPCILIMDSLKRSLHERVFKLIREYLESEWEVRRGSSRDFIVEQMQSSHCKVPLQDNSSDCGLYLLQYVESFLADPVVHFDLPLQLHRWFPRQQVRRKRDGIRDLILNLYRRQNLDSDRAGPVLSLSHSCIH